MNETQIAEVLLKAKRTLSLNEVCERTGLSHENAKHLLAACAEQGLIVSPRQGKYCHPDVMKLTLCRARSSQNAPTFARPLDGSNDFYLDMPNEQAFDGDLVFVRQTQGGEKRRGTLAQIVRRGHDVLTGTLYIEKAAPPRKRHRSKGRPRYMPEDINLALLPDRRFPSQAVVTGDLMGARQGDMCAFEVIRWPLKGVQMIVRVRQVFGMDDDLGAHLSALCALHNISEEFSPDTLAEAAELGCDPRPSDTNGRLDLRGETIFTLDGADAQDFDDAVSLKSLDDGWELGVHIADVSHYVRPGSALDADARERGTSVYLPGRTIPMLPEALCNCLCSLMPERDRLTMSAIMTLDKSLSIKKLQIRESVIRSKARLTYEDVNEMFAGRKSTVPEALHDTLRQMNELAKKLHAQRIKQGSLELDLPEVAFTLDEGGFPTGMGTRQRGDAQRLIEEFMLMANKAVAWHAEKTGLPFPYRVHEKPDSEKLASVELMLLALNKPMKVSEQRLRAVLDAFEGTSQAAIVGELVLRAMSKARYSEKNLGHFGLAFKDYCHFTSPIRRYPDLLAHRMLRMQMQTPLSEERALSLTQSMHALTEEASENEEQAALCEREADKLMCAAYLSNHQSEVFDATVTRFIKKGACVSLSNGCEGLVPFRDMDDIYSPDENGTLIAGKRTRRIIHLGDTIQVRCTKADIDTGDIEFCMPVEKKSAPGKAQKAEKNNKSRKSKKSR